MRHYHLILLTHIFVLLHCFVPEVKCRGGGITLRLFILSYPHLSITVKNL